MTLIIGKIVGNQIFIVCDTKLTYEQDKELYLTQNSLTSGTIKTIILSEKICLSFSGKIITVNKVLKEIGNSKDIKHIIETINSIKSMYINTKLDADFLLAYYNPECHMIEFKGSNPNPVQSTWLGSYNGFSEYQDRYHNYPNQIESFHGVIFSIERVPDNLSEDESNILSNMRRSIEHVINNDTIDTVGGFSITVAIINNSFTFVKIFDIKKFWLFFVNSIPSFPW